MDFQVANFKFLLLQSWRSYLEYCLYHKKTKRRKNFYWLGQLTTNFCCFRQILCFSRDLYYVMHLLGNFSLLVPFFFCI